MRVIKAKDMYYLKPMTDLRSLTCLVDMRNVICLECLSKKKPDIIEPNDYIDYLIFAYADGFEFMEEVDYKTLESCDDYKRGYERMLYIYELFT
jgi:hypothetical protein